MECSICVEKFTTVLRKKIACPACKQEVCKSCVEFWLVERTNITCPCCNSSWTYKYAMENIGKAFLDKKYKKVQKDLLFNMEKSFMDETQKFLEIEKELENQQKELVKYEELYDKYKAMGAKDMRKDEYIIQERLFEVLKSKRDINLYFKQMIKNTKLKIKSIETAVYTGNMESLENADFFKKINTEKPVCPCPINECKGYIKSSTHKCGICETKICKDCNIILRTEDVEHVCKEEDKLTVATIVKNSKPCPKCGTRIQKSEGCAQMYCTQCKTAFDYRTGKIETGRIHNPHYYEELRKLHGENIPREPGDTPGCDDQLEFIPILREFNTMRTVKKDTIAYQYIALTSTYMDYHRRYNHIVAQLREIRVEDETTFVTNFLQRFKYMKNLMSEDSFKTNLYKKFKQNMYNKEIKSEIDAYNRTLFLLVKNVHPHIVEINQMYSKMEKEKWNEYFTEKMKEIVEIKNIIDVVDKKVVENLNGICKIYNYKPTYQSILWIADH